VVAQATLHLVTWMPKVLTALGLLAVLATAAPAWQAPATDLSDQLLQQVLEPLRTGMQTQNIQMALSVFDNKELEGYSNLEKQLRAFFQQFSEVTLRYQLLQATGGKDRASATVDVQMDALPYEQTQIAVRRSVQMRLQLKLDSKGWKIAAFTPEDFFNVEYSPK
jgi:hypothetical protein